MPKHPAARPTVIGRVLVPFAALAGRICRQLFEPAPIADG
jgi:hypothetical protein